MSVKDMLGNMQSREDKCPHYLLMNKDKEVCEFIIRGEGDFEECISIRGTADIPLYFGSVDSWVINRSAAKHRKHVIKILENTGGNTKKGFIALTHCLSLNDTFWVKSCEEAVSWKDVNLYDNEFSDVVSKLAFDGTGLFGEQFSVTSPELTTDGAFDKCWIRRDSDILLIKAGSTGFSNAGREPYSEVLASQVFRNLLVDESVEYWLERFNGKVVSVCKLFTDENKSYLPHVIYMRAATSLPELIREFDKYGCVDKFVGMMIGDCITVNTDRHYKNFGWYVEPGTSSRITMSPVFDFNMAMAAYADDIKGFDDFDSYMESCRPVIGSDYVSPAKSLLTPAYRAKLINLKDLYLTVQCDDLFTEDRLRKINIIKNVMIDRILGRNAEFKF